MVRWQEMPVVHVKVPVLRVPMAPSALMAQTRWVADTVRSNLPPTDRLIYYGGLGALAVFGVLEWPVAAAVGLGVMIAAHAGQRRTRVAR